MKRLKSKSIGLNRALAVAVLLVLSTPAFAVLGDNAASVLNDQARMKGTLHSIDRQTYVMHEITAPSGAKLREYVTPAGAVFGVAWDGQFPPNFEQVLGAYYQQAQQAVAEQKSTDENSGQPVRRRGPAVIQTPGIVLVQTGHMRSYHGFAYIPQLIPQGATAADVR